jgi:hypothetical protein
MKKVLLVYAVLIVAIAAWWLIAENGSPRDGGKPPKDKALTVSKHSDAFNESIKKVMDDYYQLVLNFSNADIISAKETSDQLKIHLEELKLDDLKKDTAGIYETAVSQLEDTKGSLQQLIDEPTLEQKRNTFNMVSDNLYGLLNTIHYDSGEIYWMECSSAFGEGSSGFWLSNKEKSENPYGQKDCGVVRKTINVPKK